jgi:hypothetical protein
MLTSYIRRTTSTPTPNGMKRSGPTHRDYSQPLAPTPTPTPAFLTPSTSQATSTHRNAIAAAPGTRDMSSRVPGKLSFLSFLFISLITTIDSLYYTCHHYHITPLTSRKGPHHERAARDRAGEEDDKQ